MCKFSAWTLFLLGCTQPGMSERIELDQPNALGAIAIDVSSFEDDGQVVELRGVTAAGDEVASVRRRNGVVADLSEYLPGTDNLGSEVIVKAGSYYVRKISREQDQFHLDWIGNDELQSFLDVEAVSAALARDANVINVHAPAAATPSDELAYVAARSCLTSEMLTTPIAKQCCSGNKFSAYTTMHVNPANAPKYPGAMLERYRNPYGTGGCKSSSGGSCSGDACYYGPLAFARVIVTTSSPYWVISAEVVGSTTMCAATGYSSPHTPVFPDVTGTAAINQTCPGGSNGTAAWDY